MFEYRGARRHEGVSEEKKLIRNSKHPSKNISAFNTSDITLPYSVVGFPVRNRHQPQHRAGTDASAAVHRSVFRKQSGDAGDPQVYRTLLTHDDPCCKNMGLLRIKGHRSADASRTGMRVKWRAAS
ncbi:hypothetical protein EVAR_90617_1 [Eumeta japonica]|uniref:Uncharacterized protein n=1 Tax=Eumeta variegata TaxID=151549 RepID=A0A4C1ZTG2_EUMVA|nr:hypothetical protein EVAR_90617_1 [Eumeta japonica]